MLCFLTVRKLKPGAYDAFRAAWQPDEFPEDLARRFTAIYHLRSVEDPDEVISFGLFDGDRSDLEAMRSDSAGSGARDRQAARIAEHVVSTGADAVYEVVEQIEPATLVTS